MQTTALAYPWLICLTLPQTTTDLCQVFERLRSMNATNEMTAYSNGRKSQLLELVVIVIEIVIVEVIEIVEIVIEVIIVVVEIVQIVVIVVIVLGNNRPGCGRG